MKPFAALLGACLCVFSALAQPVPSTREEMSAAIAADPSLATSFHHHYEEPKTAPTPAPKGYKPFYISHYGRHGERYHIWPGTYVRVIVPLESLDSAGLLAPRGKQLLEDLRFIRQETVGMEGILTQKGAFTHRGISERMFRRFPQVFSQKGRDSVVSVSTPVHRCILSMNNFTLQLKNNAPRLRFFFDSGDRYRDYLCNYGERQYDRSVYQLWRDSLYANVFPADDMLEPLVTDLDAAKAYYDCSPGEFCSRIASALDITNCLDGKQPEVASYLPFEGAWLYWWDCTAKTIISNANSVECGSPGPVTAGRPLLKDFVEKADRAVTGSGVQASPGGQTVCADLRFGHDTGIMPLVALLDLNGLGQPVHALDEPWKFPVSKVIPMGCNLQMVFFRGRGGDVLVQLLLDEEEVTVPALSDAAVSAVFYPWPRLREYFVSKL